MLTTPATTADNTVTATIQERLAGRELLPRTQFVDSGYVTADHLVSSAAEHGCDLLGPIHEDASWQARATCPQGKASREWKPTRHGAGHPVIRIRFAPGDCGPCPVRPQCVASTRERTLLIWPQPQYAALNAARQRQHTAEFKAEYTRRAGVEGTIAQGVSRGDLRRTRYRGLRKTRLLHLVIAAALNLARIAAWLAERPRAQTRISAFARLAPAR